MSVPTRREAPSEAKVTPQAAHMNLRRALVDLSERHNDVLRDILQQARHIERYHHRHTDTLHTMVSHTDRRHMEGPNESLFANLETSEIRSEDAPSASNVHTEMTREGIPREEVMNLLRRRGINEDLVQALLGDFEQSGYVAQGPIDHRSEISEPEGGGQLATLLDDDKHSGHKKRLGKYLACLLLVGIMNILMSIVFLLTLPTPFTGNADTIALQMEGNDKEATTAAAETPLYLAAQKGDANMVDALPEEILEASRKALLPTSGDRPEELPQDGPNAVLAFAPADLQCLSSLRAVSRDVKERTEAGWWKEQVRQMKAFVSTGQPQRIKAMKKTKEKNEPEVILSDHDPFVCRCCIHCIALLSLEHNLTSFQRFVDLTLPKLLFDLFYSEQIDKSSGEAVVLFFANILHSSKQIQAQIMKGADIVQLLLSSRDMLFSPHTISRCLSALLCIARIPDFKRVAARLQRSARSVQNEFFTA
eukprot:g12764.t1